MLVTIRTGPHSQAQGEFVERSLRVDFNPVTGEISKYERRATIIIDGKPITGELIERKER